MGDFDYRDDQLAIANFSKDGFTASLGANSPVRESSSLSAIRVGAT